jgi:hypothetical protein
MSQRKLPLLLMLGAGCSVFGGDEHDVIDLDLQPAPPLGDQDQPVVLFAVHSANVVVPLACMNPGWEASRAGQACLELLPEREPRLDIGDGETAEVLDRTSVQCLSGRSLLGLDMAQRLEVWPVVTWSPAPVSWCRFEKAREGEALDPAIEAALQRTAASLDLGLEPPSPERIRIEPIYRLDLDGDGQLDHVARAVWPDPDPVELAEDEEPPPPPPPPQREMLVLIGGYQAMRFDMPLPQLVELTGAVDLDRDGRCELVAAAEREDGSSVALARWNGRGVELITAYECGL